MGGHDPYSASKGAVELVFSSYLRAFFANREGFGAATARAGNVIGGGDWSADRIVPDFVRAIDSGTPIKLRSPHATRPEPVRVSVSQWALSSVSPACSRSGWKWMRGKRSCASRTS